MWQCSQCGEDVDEAFRACWQCGASCDGTPDTNFVHADAYAADSPELRPQFSLRTVFRLIAAVAVMTAPFAVIRRTPTWLIVANLIGVAIVAGYFWSWFYLRLAQKPARGGGGDPKHFHIVKRTG